MNVGQGDGALLISPLGETVLFDDGDRSDCDRPVSYLQQLGVTRIDYHIASHYHDDHIGCAVPVLQDFPLQKAAYDRGGWYKSKTFTNYTNFVGTLRKTVVEGSALVLDAGSATPVRIEFVALNGNGVAGAKDENDLSVVCVVRFGQFDAVMGGDLSGENTFKYRDIETSVSPKVRQVEVYKVDHHGSEHSSNLGWLSTIKPKIGIISCGNDNTYGHPTKQALDRLHGAGVITYWTELGKGASPVAGQDKVSGNIIVETAPNSATFTVTYAGTQTDNYEVWNPVGAGNQFSWSKQSQIYHFASCKYVQNISPANLMSGTTPPPGKTPHSGCPK